MLEINKQEYSGHTGGAMIGRSECGAHPRLRVRCRASCEGVGALISPVSGGVLAMNTLDQQGEVGRSAGINAARHA